MKKIIEKVKFKINWESVRFFLNKTLVVCGIVLASVVLICAGAYLGYSYGSATPKNIVIKGVSNLESSGEVKTDVDFSVFWQAWDLLKRNHIEGANLKDKDLMYGAISGMIDAAKDPHTVFLSPDDSKKFEQDIQGEFGGIGAELGVKDDYIVVIAPLEDTPAMRAGLKAGDKILEINGKTILKANVNDVVKQIRGEVGTQVTLGILSDGNTKIHDVTLTRATISVPTLKWKMEDNGIAYVQLFSFNEQAPYLFYKAATGMMLGNVKGIVFDLRNNPGGYLEVAVNLAGWFFDKNTLVVSEEPRNGSEIKFTANGNGVFKDVPIVVLVNKGSASASEILAGALRDNRKVKLIGEQTFGKGTVQDLENLKDGSQIKMTIARWVMPSGNIIMDSGLKPDIEVKITDKDIEAGKDPQLDRALLEVQKMISQ